MVISLSPAPNPFLLYRKLFQPRLLSLSRLLKKKSWTGQLCFDYTSGMVCLGLSENHPFKGPDSFPSATVKGEACPRLGDGPAMGLDQGSLMWFPVFHASLFSNCFHANRILMLFLMHCDLCSHTELPLEYLFSWASWSKRCSSKRSLGRSENHSGHLTC